MLQLSQNGLRCRHGLSTIKFIYIQYSWFFEEWATLQPDVPASHSMPTLGLGQPLVKLCRVIL